MNWRTIDPASSREQMMAAEDHARTRVLLWSPEGAGHSYPAPGIATYRLYMSGMNGALDLFLAHGLRTQEQMPLFKKQFIVGDYNRSSLAQVRFLLGARQWIDEYVRRFDVFHGVSSYHACALPAYWAEMHGVPSVLRVASYQGDLADKGGWRQIIGLARKRRDLIRRLSGIVAISSAIARELLSYGLDESKIALIPNGVDTERFRPVESSSARAQLRRELGWPDLPTVLSVGRIHRSKQPHYLLHAAAALLRQDLDVHFAFVGPVDDTTYYNELTKYVEQAGLSSRVTWSGFTTDIAKPYQAADIFALPSQREGMPNVLLEAMASGLAVVTTPVSGATDAVIHDQCGTVIEDTPDSAFHALADYLGDELKRTAHGAAARRRAVDVFSVSTVYAAHENLFRQIRQPGGRAGDASLLTLDRS